MNLSIIKTHLVSGDSSIIIIRDSHDQIIITTHLDSGDTFTSVKKNSYLSELSFYLFLFNFRFWLASASLILDLAFPPSVVWNSRWV